MAGQGILIIIIPNDLSVNEQKSLDSTQEIEHSKEFPCSTCGSSLTSRFRHHISPKLNLIDAIWILSEDQQNFFITCFAELGPHSDIIIEELRLAEIGIRQGSKVFILPLSCAVGVDKLAVAEANLVKIEGPQSNDETEILLTNDPEINEKLGVNQSDFKRSIRARLTVLQVVNAIRGQTSFSFDFLLLTILASIISLIGLLEDNAVILVASMLVSPLMGPILGIVFGLCIGDATLWKVGLKTEIIGLGITILTGFIVGLCTTWAETRWGSSGAFPTDQMRSRGDIRRLWAGALVALPSGAGAALSVLGGNVGSLVGVAISASLLPPAVNAGLLSSYALLASIFSSIGTKSSKDIDYESVVSYLTVAKNCTAFVENKYLPLYSCDMTTDAGLLGICSFLLTIVNIICIIVVAMVILRIKEVVPIVRDDEIAQFWHDDVRIYRGHNKTIGRNDVSNLVNMWKSIVNQGPSSVPLGHTNRTFVRKLRNLQEFAQAYNLNLSNDDDIHLRTGQSRRNIQRMANDLQKTIDETNQLNLGSFVAQMRGPNQRKLAQERIQTFYHELVEVMPEKWKEIFEEQSK